MLNKEEIIRSWIDSSDRNFISMEYNFKGKQFEWSLFIGHLFIEKLVKAYYVKTQSKNPIPIHNLQRLAELANLELNVERQSWLADITAFNIEARYEEQKQEFHNKCTEEFTTKYISIIKS